LQQEQDKLVDGHSVANLPSPQSSPASGRGSERERQSLIPESLRELIVTGVVLRENLVKLDGIPLVFRAPSLPELPANSRVQLAIVSIDLLDLDVQTRFVSTIEEVA
jgi:hypothetical protein